MAVNCVGSVWCGKLGELTTVRRNRLSLERDVPDLPQSTVGTPAPVSREESAELGTTGQLSHFSNSGESRMVDVAAKPVSLRRAVATGEVRMSAETLRLIRDVGLAKGNVFEVARLAGIMAAKRTGELIPLCHPLGLDSVEIGFETPNNQTVRIRATVSVHGRTGVEMEALTAVSITALTIYDMCKAVDRGIVIGNVLLEEKSGGRSGVWRRHDSDTTASGDT